MIDSPIGVQMHGATLNLNSNNHRLLEYAQSHLHDLAGPPIASPHFQIHAEWSEGEWDPEANPFPVNGDLQTIGKRMLGREDDLIWLNTLRMKGLQLRFRRNAAAFAFDVAYKFHLRPDKLAQSPEYEYKRYFSLMSYLVYYPLMWHLESKRGWTLLHASALRHRRGAILIGGLGGVGKTTTCISLMQRAGLPLISENIVFIDDHAVYPCYEPIRLDANSLDLLGEETTLLQPMAFPDGLKEKWLFHAPGSRITESCPGAALFLPAFSPRRYLRRIAPEIAAEKLLAMNRLTMELDDYGWYAAALEIIWPQPGLARQRAEVLHGFTRNIRCYEMGIDRTAGVDAVVDQILTTVEKQER